MNANDSFGALLWAEAYLLVRLLVYKPDEEEETYMKQLKEKLLGDNVMKPYVIQLLNGSIENEKLMPLVDGSNIDHLIPRMPLTDNFLH